MHHRVGATLDTGCRALLVNHAAQGFHGRGFAQGEVQRVDVAAAHVEHAADVAVGSDDFTDAFGVHQFQLGVAEALPELLLRLQVAHLLGAECGEHATVLQVALDVVLGDALANDAAAFEGHLAEQLRLLRADGAFDDVDVAAIAVDDLTAVAPGRAKANLGRFEDSDLEAVFQQEQGSREAGIASTYNAHVGFGLALEFGAGRDRIGRCCVVGGGVWSVRHIAPVFVIFYEMCRCYPTPNRSASACAKFSTPG
ncbi:hypothetical protein D3C76_772890 [compost metagenome]